MMHVTINKWGSTKLESPGPIHFNAATKIVRFRSDQGLRGKDEDQSEETGN